MRRALPLALVLLACGAGGDSPDAVDGGLPEPDALAAPSCPPDPANPSWLAGALDDDLRKLTGIESTPGGANIPERSTAGNRNATRAYLQDRFAELGYATLFDDYGTGINVYAELAATQPTANTIVLGAHFDSVPGSPGANDNATGVAMVLAASRYAQDLPCRSQNLLFVLFDEEELGLIGSDFFAQLVSRQDFGATITAVHTIDQNGWDSDGDRAFELERADPGLAAMYQSAKNYAGASMPIHETITGSTDHVSFRTYGLAAVGITEEYVNGDTTPHYHLSSDTYDTVDQEYLLSTTRVFLTMVGERMAIGSASARQVMMRPSLSERFARATRVPRHRPPARPAGCRGARGAVD